MADPHRPGYHFTAPSNWLNDPNGLIQWQGTYHLFYQHNPNAANWGDIHWGHAASTDLLRWQHLPVALAPAPGTLDQSGVWSGCAVDWDGVPAVLYTARDGERESVFLATSQDSLRTWEKHPANPVISGPPPGLKTHGFRDPYVWREGGQWKMVIGSGVVGQGGLIFLYASQNLTDWKYLGVLVEDTPSLAAPYPTGGMWECPNFFPLGQQQVLLIASMETEPPASLYTLYFTGAYHDNRFTPQYIAKLDGGDLSCYAPQAFRDEQGRTILFGWARELRGQDAQVAAGWAGVMTLPRLLGIEPSGRLTIQPVPEVESLRAAETVWQNVRIAPDEQIVPLEGLSGDSLEIEAVMDFSEASSGSVSLLLRRSPDGSEQTEICFERDSRKLVVDTHTSSLDVDTETGRWELPVELSADGRLCLRVFLDRSILEVYANETVVITARIYPQREDSLGVALQAREAPVHVERISAWELYPVMDGASNR
jgi:beta-fructofuranosidase